MDNLQYMNKKIDWKLWGKCAGFKPCYKWIIFNIKMCCYHCRSAYYYKVLNLVING